jgi:hypothetical protein
MRFHGDHTRDCNVLIRFLGSLQQDPFYQVISLKPDRSNLDQADKQMPGLKSFLLG